MANDRELYLSQVFGVLKDLLSSDDTLAAISKRNSVTRNLAKSVCSHATKLGLNVKRKTGRPTKPKQLARPQEFARELGLTRKEFLNALIQTWAEYRKQRLEGRLSTQETNGSSNTETV